MPTDPRGRPASYPRRQMANAMLDIARTGCPWRYLPEGVFPPWPAVWQQFRRWRDAGVWEQVLTRLRRAVRVKEKRHPEPSMVMVDAQVVRGARNGRTFHEAGGRGGRTFGAKRTVLVDYIGCPVAVEVSSARPHDVSVARPFLRRQVRRLPRLSTVMGDRGYVHLDAVCRHAGLTLVIKTPPATKPRRFVAMKPLVRVEHAFSWLGRYRRLARSYEDTIASAQAWLEIAACGFLFSRLR